MCQTPQPNSREHTAVWPAKAECVAANLADFLHGLPDASATVVLASYSLHHFSSDAKDELINECHRVLASGGTLIWIDAVRRNDQSRDAYIEDLTHIMYDDWTALTPEQREKACTHVRESDFPETAQWMLDHVHAADFAPPIKILERPFFDGWAFTRT